MRCIVVFQDSSGHPLSWLLKRGFRHCFVCVLSNGLWIQVDGREGVPEIRYLTQDDGFDLAGFYREQGCTVVETRQRQTVRWWLLTVLNCVGLVKSVLALRSWAITPYQLYLVLRR